MICFCYYELALFSGIVFSFQSCGRAGLYFNMKVSTNIWWWYNIYICIQDDVCVVVLGWLWDRLLWRPASRLLHERSGWEADRNHTWCSFAGSIWADHTWTDISRPASIHCTVCKNSGKVMFPMEQTEVIPSVVWKECSCLTTACLCLYF